MQGNMPFYVRLAQLLPSIEAPTKRLTLREKLKWTAIVLVLFFAMGSVMVYGVAPEAVHGLEFYEVIFGARIGSLATLGIGPIVMAGIILQMLVGSKIIPWDLRREEDKIKYNAAQKLLTIFFCFFEAVSYTLSFVHPASPELTWLVVLQLALGGIIIMYFDEITSKWGIGSGVSLFIAAGVSQTIIWRLFYPPLGEEYGMGIIPSFFVNLFAGNFSEALLVLTPLFATIIVFAIVVFTQGIRVEIPITFTFAFGRVPARKWPLRFFYTSNIPVILAAALLANITLFGRMLYQRGITLLGVFDERGHAIGGLAYFLTPPLKASLALCALAAFLFALGAGLFVSRKYKKYALRTSFAAGAIGFILAYLLLLLFEPALNIGVPTPEDLIRAFTYTLAMVVLSTIFSVFWMNTAGMDPKSVAEQFKASYLSVPGFRRDPRIIERLLEKYIPALAVLGGAFVGFIAAFANLTLALGTGTGILLTAIIIMQFYESIVAQHLEDMHPALRKFMGR